MTELVIGVVIRLTVVVLFGPLLGALSNQFNDLKDCEENYPKWKFWCTEQKSPYDEIAENSVKALACAINAAGTGEMNCPGSSACKIQASLLPTVSAQSTERCYGDSYVNVLNKNEYVSREKISDIVQIIYGVNEQNLDQDLTLIKIDDATNKASLQQQCSGSGMKLERAIQPVSDKNLCLCEGGDLAIIDKTGKKSATLL